LNKASQKDPVFAQMLSYLDEVVPSVLAPDFSSSVLRYGKDDGLSRVNELVSEIFPIAFKVRRIVKHYIKDYNKEVA